MSSIPPDPKGSLAIRLSNLRKLHSNLEFYLSQVMSLPIEDPVDLGEIARNNDSSHILKLLELVMCVAVQCQQKEKYIGRILQLPEACQAELMFFIEKILAKSRRLSMSTEVTEVSKVKKLNQELTREVENLNQELSAERKEHQLFRMRVQEMTTQAKSRSSDKPDSLKLELEEQLVKQLALAEEFTSQLSDLKKKHESELGELRDELDIANDRVLQLSQLEGTIEGYRKKSEEILALRKQMKELEAYNDALSEKMRTFEEQHASDLQVHEMLQIYKEQFAQEKDRNAVLTLRMDAVESDFRDGLKQKQELSERCKLLDRKVQDLSSQLSLVVRPPDESPPAHPFSSDLEEKMKSFVGQSSAQTVEELRKHFNEQLDEALRDKHLAEEKCKQMGLLVDTLRNAASEAKSAVSELKPQDLTDEMKVLTEHNNVLVVKCERLEVEVKRLQNVVMENERLKAEKDAFMLENAKLYREKDEIGQKFIASKDTVMELVTESAEKEKQLQKCVDEASKLREQVKTLQEAQTLISAPSITSDPVDFTDIQTTMRLEQEIKELNEELSKLKTSLSDKEAQIQSLQTTNDAISIKLKEIVPYTTLYFELKATYSNLESLKEQAEQHHLEALDQLQDEITGKEQEIKEMEAREEDLRKSLIKEERLMSIILHDLGMELFRGKARRNGATHDKI